MYNALGTIIRRTPQFSYRVQAHHLIPVEQMAETSTLQENAVLAGWDINGLVNGSFHPQDEMDVAVHELQQHLGSHCGDYTNPIAGRLTELEEFFETMCHGKETVDAQVSLVQELEALSETALRKVLAIRSGRRFWPLHNNSLSVYRGALAEYARRETLHEEGG